MRDKNRIPKICEKFEKVWRKYPDMRFGQLVVNCLGVDPYYIEDNIIEKKIEEFGKLSEDTIENFEIIKKTVKYVKLNGEEFEIEELKIALKEFLELENKMNCPYTLTFTKYSTAKKLVKIEYIQDYIGARQTKLYKIKDQEHKEKLEHIYNQIKDL